MAMIGPRPSCTPIVAQSDIGTPSPFRPSFSSNAGSCNEVLAGGMQCIPDRPNGHRLR